MTTTMTNVMTTNQSRPETNYNCTKCGRCYIRISCLRRHMRGGCDKKPQFQCRLCKKWFKYKHNLNAHMKFHVEEPKHQCMICPKRFYRGDKLSEHERNTHFSNLWSRSDRSSIFYRRDLTRVFMGITFPCIPFLLSFYFFYFFILYAQDEAPQKFPTLKFNVGL